MSGYLIRKPYWEWVKDEARKIKSDGCTGVSNWNRPCCEQHDLACRYQKDPRSAHEYYFVDPSCNYWTCAKRMSRRQADYQFASCNLEWNTPGKVGKVRGVLRFLGVRAGTLLGIGKREPTWRPFD